MELMEVLRKSAYTADLPDADLRALNSAMTVRSYPDGHVFIKEGSRGDTLFLLLEGEVSVRRERSTLSHDLKMMQPGEFFGQLALIDQERRAATCAAVGPVRVASLPQSAFSFLFSAHAPIAEALQRAVAVQVMRDFRNVMRQVREALARLPGEPS
jgi:CRP-like cAMP-binding protein